MSLLESDQSRKEQLPTGLKPVSASARARIRAALIYGEGILPVPRTRDDPEPASPPLYTDDFNPYDWVFGEVEGKEGRYFVILPRDPGLLSRIRVEFSEETRVVSPLRRDRPAENRTFHGVKCFVDEELGGFQEWSIKEEEGGRIAGMAYVSNPYESWPHPLYPKAAFILRNEATKTFPEE